ncbi:MAG: class I SAM-dependent methyltransferase, partial [Candidatus Binatus sp.]
AVVAVDFSSEAMRLLAATARTARLAIWPVVANLASFHLKDESFDAIVNINFLDRAIFQKFARALRPGGILIADTFLVDQAKIGHPHDPRFLLAHGELRALAGGLEIEEYREGLVTHANGERAFRASMAARRRKSS